MPSYFLSSPLEPAAGITPGQILWLSCLIIGLLFHTAAFSSLLLQKLSILTLTQLLTTTNIAFSLYGSLRLLNGDGEVSSAIFWVLPVINIVLALLSAWQCRSWRKLPPCCGFPENSVIEQHRSQVIASWYWGLVAPGIFLQIVLPGVGQLFATAAVALLGILAYRFAQLRQTQTINLFSVKNSYEVLTDGLMFFDSHGQPLTINQTMETVLSQVKLPANSSINQIWDYLSLRAKEQHSPVQSIDNLATQIGADSWYYFSRKTIESSLKLVELRVSDCTSYIALLNRIESHRTDLKQSIQEVKQHFINLEQIEKEKLLLQTRAQLHDVLSQRISVIRRSLEDGVHDGHRLGEIIHLLKHIEDELLGQDSDNLQQTLVSLINSFEHNNLKITITGPLPEEPEIMKTWVAVIREAATNAIVHGDATELQVNTELSDSHIRLTISNNGFSQYSIREGNGIRGIRYRLGELGGSLQVQTRPRFALIAELPRSQRIPPS